MGQIDLEAVFAATAAFWLLGVLWYGVLFARPWQRAAGGCPPPAGARLILVAALAFAFQMLVVLTVAHLVARTNPPPHVVIMMAAGFAITVMTPAVGLSYLLQRRPVALFLIDPGYFLIGLCCAGAVLVALT